MEERQHQAAWLQDLVDAGEYRLQQRLGQIVRSVPKNDHIEHAPGEVEVGSQGSHLR